MKTTSIINKGGVNAEWSAPIMEESELQDQNQSSKNGRQKASLISLKVIHILFVIFAMTLQVQAQSNNDTISMTLEECLGYAKEHSITLKQASLIIENRATEEQRAIGNFMPNISAAVGQDLRLTPLTTVGDITTYSGSYGIDLSLPLITGGQNKATLQQSRIESDIAKLSFLEQENFIEVSITETFVQILYAMEQIEVAENTLLLNEKSVARGEAYLEVGRINQSDFAQLESAHADSEYNLIVAKSTLSNLNVQMKHLLEISQDIQLAITPPILGTDFEGITLSTVSEVYDAALRMRPEIAISTLSIASAELDEKMAKSGYYPSLSLTAGTGINHGSSSSFTFSDQMRNNFNTSFGLKLSVPIFSAYRNKTNVELARNAITSATLTLTDNQKALYQTIETLHNNATNAKAKFMVSDHKLEAVKKSLQLTTEQYNLGMKNIIELLTEQDNYLEASQEYLTNKYQFILNNALLEYYKTDEIKL